MKIETAIIAVLESLAAVTALVSQRIYADDAEPGEELPYIIVNTVRESSSDQSDLQGNALLWDAEVHIECYGRTRSLARDIEEAVRFNGTDPGTGLQGYEGNTGQGTIEAAWSDDIDSGYLEPASEEDTGKYVTVATYTVQYTKPSHSY